MPAQRHTQLKMQTLMQLMKPQAQYPGLSVSIEEQ